MNKTNSQLFDMIQRQDGAWVVWTRKSPAELGLVNRSQIETSRGEAFTDQAWNEFIRQAHFTEQSVWVIAATYASRPTVDTVLALLGVKRRPKTASNPPAPRRQAAPAVETAKAA